jgi:excisionase family DNA binding protein
MQPQAYFTTSQAAKELGIRQSTVQQYILAGYLPATLIGHTYIIPAEEIAKRRATIRAKRRLALAALQTNEQTGR